MSRYKTSGSDRCCQPPAWTTGVVPACRGTTTSRTGTCWPYKHESAFTPVYNRALPLGDHPRGGMRPGARAIQVSALPAPRATLPRTLRQGADNDSCDFGPFDNNEARASHGRGWPFRGELATLRLGTRTGAARWRTRWFSRSDCMLEITAFLAVFAQRHEKGQSREGYAPASAIHLAGARGTL